MKLVTFATLAFLYSNYVMAKNLSAHVHGAVHLDIAIENNQILIMLKSPSESFLGFEYKAKTSEELAKVSNLKKAWNAEIKKMLGESQLIDCSIASSKWEQVFESDTHSSIEAEAYLNCKNQASKRTLQVSFATKYPNIKSIQLQLLKQDGSVFTNKYTKDFELNI